MARRTSGFGGSNQDGSGWMKDFKTIYLQDGAYHYKADGFRAWFLQDNYATIASYCVGRKHILDLGCGEGCLAAYVTDAELDGVDYSEQAITLNRELFPGRYRRLLQSNLAALDELGLDASYYDCIACSLTLMYLEGADLDRCLAETWRLLSEGGAFVITYPTVGRHRQGSSHAAELPLPALKAVLERLGYRVIAIEPLCPFLPPSVVQQSTNETTRQAARTLYLTAAAKMTVENSYHFVIVCEK
jgi:SAM-dependent methyltransferase